MALFETEEQIKSACNEHGYLTGYVELEFEDMVDLTRTELEQSLKRALVGTYELDDLSFTPVGVTEHGLMTLYVNGKVDGIGTTEPGKGDLIEGIVAGAVALADNPDLKVEDVMGLMGAAMTPIPEGSD